MFTRNDERKRWINGTVGKILSFENNVIRVELLTDYPGNVCEVQEVTWKNYSYKYNSSNNHIYSEVSGKYTQYPMMLAWGITIHKAQGKTLEAAHVNFGRGTFEAGQAYVALSRCKTLNGLTLERPIRKDDITCSLVLKEFNNQIQAQIPDIEDLASQTTAYPNINGIYMVVGLQYGAYSKNVSNSLETSAVTLVAEPSNQHDPNAIRVDLEKKKLGYISREKNQDLSEHLKKGRKVLVVIDSVKRQNSGELIAATVKVINNTK